MDWAVDSGSHRKGCVNRFRTTHPARLGDNVAGFTDEEANSSGRLQVGTWQSEARVR